MMNEIILKVTFELEGLSRELIVVTTEERRPTSGMIRDCLIVIYGPTVKVEAVEEIDYEDEPIEIVTWSRLRTAIDFDE